MSENGLGEWRMGNVFKCKSFTPNRHGYNHMKQVETTAGGRLCCINFIQNCAAVTDANCIYIHLYLYLARHSPLVQLNKVQENAEEELQFVSYSHL